MSVGFKSTVSEEETSAKYIDCTICVRNERFVGPHLVIEMACWTCWFIDLGSFRRRIEKKNNQEETLVWYIEPLNDPVT